MSGISPWDLPSLDQISRVLDRTFPEESRRPWLYAVVYSLPDAHRRQVCGGFGGRPASDEVVTAILYPTLSAKSVEDAVESAMNKAEKLLGCPYISYAGEAPATRTYAGSSRASAGVRRRHKAPMAANCS